MGLLYIIGSSGLTPGEKIIIITAYCLALLTALILHELAHGFIAVKMGDNTPKYNGRLTLNPAAHLDVLGLVMLLLLGFGWAKPVPVNPYNFKNYKKGMVLVSLAGVVTNFILAFVTYALFVAFNLVMANVTVSNALIPLFFSEYFYYITIISLSLMAFNILPLYPLDGYRLIETLTGGRGRVFEFLRRYSNQIFIGLILLGFVADYTGLYYIDFLSTYINWIVGLIVKLFNLIVGIFV